MDTQTPERTSTRFGWSDLVTAAVTAVVVVTTFLPWGRSGRRARTSYEIVDIVGPAGVVSETYESLARAWYLVPVAAALVLCCGFWLARRTAGALLASVGASVSAFAFLVDRSVLVTTGGCRIAMVVGTGAALWGVGLIVRPRRRGRTPR